MKKNKQKARENWKRLKNLGNRDLLPDDLKNCKISVLSFWVFCNACNYAHNFTPESVIFFRFLVLTLRKDFQSCFFIKQVLILMLNHCLIRALKLLKKRSIPSFLEKLEKRSMWKKSLKISFDKDKLYFFHIFTWIKICFFVY